MRIGINSTLILLAILSSGCVATGTRFSESELESNVVTSSNLATICIYRPRKFLAGGASPTVASDEVELGSLRSGGFSVQSVTPGVHKFMAKWSFLGRPFGSKDVEFSYEFESNKVYYLRFGIVDSSVTATGVAAYPVHTTATFDFVLVKKQFALGELEDSRRLDW